MSRIENDGAERGCLPGIIQAAMHGAARDDHDLPAFQRRVPTAAKLVAGGAAQQQQNLVTLVRVPAHAPGVEAMVGRDVVHHRQAQFLAGDEEVSHGQRILERGFGGARFGHGGV